MLTFKKKFLDAIRSGEKTQTLRIWSSLRVHPGQKDFIPGVGLILIDSAEEVSFDELTDEDAIPDGFPTIASLKEEIETIYGPTPVGKLYRIRFHLAEAPVLPEPVPAVLQFTNPLEAEVKVKEESKPVPAVEPKITRKTESRIQSLVNEMKQEFAKTRLKQHLPKMNSSVRAAAKSAPVLLSEGEIVEKMIRRCRINRNVCDWNHEPCKSQDFFALFLKSPRDEQGKPTLDGYRLRSLMRDQLTEEQWEEICWIASEVCAAWTEWQYAISHFTEK